MSSVSTDSGSHVRPMVLLYANQPVARSEGGYYTRMKNFVDFLALLSSRNPDCRLIVPCRTIDKSVANELIPIALPRDLIEVEAYEGHVQALLQTLPNALRLCKIVWQSLAEGRRVIIGGPGPNSMLYLLSWLLPRTVRFAFFIRGDTAKTVNNMYKGRLIRRPATALVRLFQRRIYALMRQDRAVAFTYGSKLRKEYADHGLAFSIAPLIDEADIVDEVVFERVQRKDRTFRVLFVGRLSPEKGVIDLIDACVLAADHGRPFELTIIGHGPLAGSISARIREEGLDKWVSFVGYVPHGHQLIEYFDSHDLLCLPSYTEGVPRVVIEAFARGLPVTATPVGSIQDLFGDYVHLIHDNNPDSILEAIEWCRDNSDWLRDMASRTPEVCHLYTLEHYADYVRDHLNTFSLSGS